MSLTEGFSFVAPTPKTRTTFKGEKKIKTKNKHAKVCIGRTYIDPPSKTNLANFKKTTKQQRTFTKQQLTVMK